MSSLSYRTQLTGLLLFQNISSSSWYKAHKVHNNRPYVSCMTDSVLRHSCLSLYHQINPVRAHVVGPWRWSGVTCRMLYPEYPDYEPYLGIRRLHALPFTIYHRVVVNGQINQITCPDLWFEGAVSVTAQDKKQWVEKKKTLWEEYDILQQL